jgi:hypothetical protein
VAQSGVQNILRELGVPDVVAAERLMATEQSRRQEIATLQVQVSALVAGQGGGGVTDLRDRAALEMEQKTSALDSLGPLAGDARARERLEAEVRDRHAALERARDGEAGAIARVEANPVDAEQVAGEAERLVTWRDQLAALQRRVRIYETTLAGVTAAEGLTMRKATRFLEQQVGRDIAKLTGGRYHRVSIDDQTLDIDVWAPERNDWVPASRLSKGTIDQVFLAARIGLVRLVTQGRRPPLILDDPFVTFDDARAARAALLLRELSADFQVIYLATTNRYDGLADSVVELPGPTEVQAVAQAPAEGPRPEPAEDEAPLLIRVSDDAPAAGAEPAEPTEPAEAAVEPTETAEPDSAEPESAAEPVDAVEPVEPAGEPAAVTEPEDADQPASAEKPPAGEPTSADDSAVPGLSTEPAADADFADASSVIQFPFLRPAEGEDDNEMAGDADLDDLPPGPTDPTARTFSRPAETPGDRDR